MVTRYLLLGVTVVFVLALAGVGGLTGVASAETSASNVSGPDIDEQGADATVFEGERTIITATVENIGSSNTSFGVDLEIDGQIIESTETAPLSPGETETVTFVTFPSVENPGETSNLAVTTEDDSVSGTVTVEEAPGESSLSNLDIAGQGNDSTVEAGTDEDISIDVTNVGNGSQSFGLSLGLDGEILITTGTETLAPGETETVAFEGELAEIDPGTYSLVVASAHDTAGGLLTVELPTEGLLDDLDIAGQGANATIAEGDDEPISVTVTNAGDATGPIPVTLRVGSTETTLESSPLDPGESETVVFEGVTDDLEPMQQSVSLSTDDDEVTGIIDVTPAVAATLSTPDVAGQGHTGTVSVGDEADVAVDVTNAGTEVQSFSVTLTVGDEVEQTSSTSTLSLGETETLTFESVTGTLDRGEHVVEASTTGDAQSGIVVVEQPGTASLSELDIDGQGSDAQVHTDTTVSLSVNVTNAGDVPQNFDVAFSVNDLAETATTETLRHGDSETVSTELATDTLDAGEHQLEVSSGDVTATGILRVEESDAALTNLDIGTHGEKATIDEGTDASVTVDVMNADETAQSFDLTVSIGDTEGTVSTDTLEPGQTESVELTGLTDGLEVGQYPVTVSSNGATLQGDLIVASERAATLSGFTIAGQGESASVAAGEAVDISVDVTSAVEGATALSFDVTLAFGSETRTVATDRIRGDTTDTVTFEDVPIHVDPGEHTLSLETQADSLSQEIPVTDALAVSLDDLDVAGEGSDGTTTVNDSPSVSVTVTNQDDREANFALTVDVGPATETVTTGTVQAGSSERVTVESLPTTLPVGEHTVSVSSGDATVTGSITVEADAPIGGELADVDVAEQGVNATVSVGETVPVSVIVTNVGDGTGSVEATVTIGSISTTESTTDLTPGSEETLTIDEMTVPDTPGQYDVVVSTDTDEIVAEITVEAADDDTGSVADADDDGPGFGVIGALGALILVSLFVTRARDSHSQR